MDSGACGVVSRVLKTVVLKRVGVVEKVGGEKYFFRFSKMSNFSPIIDDFPR